MTMWAFIKLIVFILTSLPSVLRALKDLYSMAFGEKKLAKACLNDICQPTHLKLHVERELNKDKGPIR